MLQSMMTHHVMIGVQLLSQLVCEMNQVSEVRNYQFRSTTALLYITAVQVSSVAPPIAEKWDGVVVVVEMNIIKVALSHCCCKTTVQY